MTGGIVLSGTGSPTSQLVMPLAARVGGGAPAVTALTAINTARGCRVIIPKTGTLNNLYIYIGTSSGNIDAAVIDCDGTTRTALWRKGSTASPGTGWQKMGDPALAVTAGQHLDFLLGADNTTVTFGNLLWAAGSDAMNKLPFTLDGVGAASSLSYLLGTAFPIAATISEATIAAAQNGRVPLIVAQVV